MTTVQQYCLRWNNHQPNFISVFSSLLLNETLVDVTLAAEGRQLQAHKVVLSACSSYFQSLFTTNPCKHPIVILKDVQYNDLKTMVDFMYYGEVNVSTEQLPQILKTAEMLKIKGLAEMPDAASVTKSDSKSSDHTDGNQSVSGVESMWGSTESQQQQVQQQYHTIRRTPSPSNMSPATRRKRLRKTSTGSGSANQSVAERIQEEQIQHHQQQQATMDGRMLQKYTQQQQQSVDVPLSTFSTVTQTGAIANVRGLKINSSPDGQLQHQQEHEHIDESQHMTEMKTEGIENLSCVNQSMPLDISTGTSTPVSCPPTHQQHSSGQWAVIDTNYSRFVTSAAAALPTSTVQHSSTAHHHHHHHHHEGNAVNTGGSGGGGSSGNTGNDTMSSHGSNNSNSNNNTAIQSQTSTPVQLQYQTTYSPQIIAVNPNSIVNNYPPSISTPTSPIVQSVYSQQSTPIQSPVNIQNSTSDANSSASNNNVTNVSSGNVSTGSSAPPKRKRSVNPQGEENFLRALDAVRFGGIGFCKAARLYGVNNRTLWLEFKKRGYPISRPSIKSRIKTEPNMSPPPAPSTPSAEENTMENYESNIQQQSMAGPSSSSETSATPIMCPPHHPMGVMGFLDTRHVDFTAATLQHQMSRQRYPDGTTVNMNPSSVNIQGINFNSM